LENCAEFLRDADLIATLDLGATNSRIAADPSRLQQVFSNLIINAARCSPPRTYLTIRTRNTAGRFIEIEFQDEGRGLEASHLEQIFEPFAQVRPGGAEGVRGLGLGLSIGRSIVESHGGSIVAESPGPGRGATFRVLLPASEPTGVETIDRPRATRANHEQNVERVSESVRQCTRPTTILLVEDNPDSLSALVMSLSMLGFEVHPADSLRTALAAATREHYDLIVSDLELGDGSGLDLLTALGPSRSVPAIALTGYGSEEDRKTCLEAGFELHLTKPIQTRQLSEAIHSVMQKQSIHS
jgi:CheY-like chemotaxis protein